MNDKAEKKITITFSVDAIEDILDMFDKKVDEEGYLVEKDCPEQRVLTPEGEEILKEEWVGIYKGHYYKNDLLSLMKIADEMDKREDKL